MPALAGRGAGRPKKAMAKVIQKAVQIKKKKSVPSRLLQRGRVDKAVIRRATQMTSEEWKRHQVGMEKKWPLPDYMGGQRGHMKFREETFAQVTRWTAETKIAYRPHAKAPGSKSHIRYEQYSKARTVGEALKFGTYPVDWCWDFERGFLRVVGGRILDEPKDESDRGAGTFTEVDSVIHNWYKKDLATRLGLKVADLSNNQGSGESICMRGERLLAQKQAEEFLAAADLEGRAVTDEEVLQVLKRWAYIRNIWRQNVMPAGQEWVFSDTLGVLRDRNGSVHLTAPTLRYPQVAEIVARWLTERLPEEAKHFTFTSMNLNCNYAARQHRDNGNFGPSFIRAFGEFTGGKLQYWPEDAGGKLEQIPEKEKVVIDIRKGLTLFNGNCAHAVEDFSGARYSVVYFTVGCHPQILAEDKAKLQRLCIPCPSLREDPYILLRPPRGYGSSKKTKTGAAEASSAGVLASKRCKGKEPWHHWAEEKLRLQRRPGGVKAAAARAKARLAPASERAFYTSANRWKMKLQAAEEKAQAAEEAGYA